ncbi:hypothetical protein F9Z73_23430, partial [Escherichia coli]
QGGGFITAKAVMLFKSSLRCGVSGAKRLPCANAHKVKRMLYFISDSFKQARCVIYIFSFK